MPKRKIKQTSTPSRRTRNKRPARQTRWKKRLLIAGGILVFALLLCGGVWHAAKPNLLDERIAQAVDFMLAMEESDGSFKYQFNYETGEFSDKNSIVRQAGATFGLAEYYRATRDGRVANRLRQALQTLESWSVGDDGKQFVKGPRKKDKIRSGASALTLMTTLLYQDIHADDSSFTAWRENLKRGLCSLLVPGQGIAISPDTTNQSPYFDGETWLALAMYADRYPADALVSETLPKLEAWLMAHYKEYNGSFFHWGAMAASRRYLTTGDEKYISFALDQYAQSQLNPERMQCYALEGVGGIALALPKGHPAREKLIGDIKISLEKFVLHRQFILPYLENEKPVAPNAAAYFGGFQGSSAGGLRIDDTQHCLSALLKAKDLSIRPAPIPHEEYLKNQPVRKKPAKKSARKKNL